MATTLLSDVVVPEVYIPYFRQMTLETDAFIASGVVSTPPNFSFPTSGGDLVQMPYWTPLAGDSEIDSDTVAATYGKREAGKMQARMHLRRKGWSRSDLSAALAGSDPHETIVTEDVKYWTTERQKILFSSLKGFFATAGASNGFDISAAAGAAAVADASAFVDAAQKLGDHKGNLTMLAMHSATEALLAKQGLIEYETTADKSDRVAMYLNKRVIIDDTCPVTNGVYTTYLFGQGAIGYETGTPVGFTNVDMDRDIDLGIDKFLRREAFYMHINGSNWTETTVAAAAPTNAELETAANWTLWENAKNIPIVEFKHRNAPV